MVRRFPVLWVTLRKLRGKKTDLLKIEKWALGKTSTPPSSVYFNSQSLYVSDCIPVLFDNRFAMTNHAILANCVVLKSPLSSSAPNSTNKSLTS
ncbi:hypothetical protein M404DRAFT_19204 [Pisolithus tinctorius Marx 270]|uniref:Uncharacterized protein n=1 Tax=Pisolithus tinctorius Marx 270 TaxID=870435 RepID=A0A0C3PEU8_PISTI|nr:hypothetical protein M404DRAFT_19198 [Pisolithus tinctorius Marx 270]KIO12362.1 hypothetical protein M404DRAFT_19204 [Pisolithus tinctorius Marx 270]